MTTYHDVAQASYELGKDDDAWVDGIVAAASGLFRADAAAYIIRPNAAPTARIGAVAMRGSAFAQQTADAVVAHADLPTDVVKSLYAGGPFVGLWSEKAVELRANADADASKFLDRGDESQRRTQAPETIGAFGGSRDGGCMLCIQTSKTSLAPRTRWALRRMAVHIEAAFRLRESPTTEPDALVDERGVVVERRVPLDGDEGEIERAFRQMTESAATATSDPEGALAVWRGLVAGRWSLVRSSDQQNRRTLLLRRNELPESQGDDPLSRRAASVVSLVARGHSNKLIAYELGLPISTIATDIRRVLARLGLARRADLIRLGMGGDQRPQPEVTPDGHR